jgi:uncharacterized membrane protein YgdD (TMEM256/DUF423 family)
MASFFNGQGTFFLKATGLSGALAVALGAVGAHALTKMPDAMKETWKVGSQYHLSKWKHTFMTQTSVHFYYD